MKAKKLRDLSSRRFNKWTVLSLNRITPEYVALWNCVCSCGTAGVIRGSSLTTSNSKSCGCHRAEVALKTSTKHGMSETKVWYAWQRLRDRCYQPKNKAYPSYGGRGIKVCKRWMKFDNFFADMGNPPSDMHSIDRINVNGDYMPSNCRWATQKEQANNRRSNTWLTAFGRTQTIAQWSDELGIKRPTICQRLARGATHAEALSVARPQRSPARRAP